ncbi:2-deoxy-scyllo-inosamine dehydrogenase [Poriferisphaera corsica]|uniref:2-deoxy-scyllo-inosamine dehydrogenase n=1 Tax=Poriferisphaera corsica TaxID=2528020 RepID=A0A517YVJ2_9BACT|nr:alcohol dehydrogenase catalytic domain-containing protein [Poriferisphaera corsica]QDU34244.1 2-deoxy-scyllo-inosamine dehydrogenase [Poriferisphaera corsica]
MQALVFDGNGLKYEANYADPKPAAGEALIRPTRLGVCSTDIELCKGYMGYSGVLGHEFVGVVEAVGNKEDKHWVGKRVVGTINCVCGQCDMCKAGLREHCRDRTVLGIMNRDGCFSDQFCLPVMNLLEVPENVDDDHAVFTEPLAAAYQILQQLTIEGRPFVTVLGDGRLGLLCAQVLSQLNATVRCIGKHPEKLSLCEKWGVKHRLLQDVGLRMDQDIVVDCTGSHEGMKVAMGMVRPRGTIVLKTTVAPRHDDLQVSNGFEELDLSPVVINEIKVIGSRCGPFPIALDALSAEKVDVVSLISRRMKLSDGEAAIVAAKSGAIKVLLEP